MQQKPSERLRALQQSAPALGRALAADRKAWARQHVILLGLLAMIVVVAGLAIANTFGPAALPVGVVASNGRLEAERVDIATKLPGRIKEVLIKEGDVITAGQVIARMDTTDLEAQVREAEAMTRQAQQQLKQAQALVEQRKSELTFAQSELQRSTDLVGKGFAPRETVDLRRNGRDTAAAALNSANAQVDLCQATIEAAMAKVASLRANLDDSVLVAPRSGRIQYRLAVGGEVLPAGGKVATLLDLSDVYITIYLPTADAGRLALGAEGRIIFDAAPNFVVPATVSFVAADAQFTPKYVETKSEREKLMFRVKLQIAPETLQHYAALVKTGVPGMAYVKVAREAEWPAWLAVKLPP